MKIQSKLIYKLLASVILTVYVPTAIADGLRIRGELQDIKGHIATVKTNTNQIVQVTLEESYSVLLYKDITLQQLPANAYVAIPSVPLENGKVRALGINVFPEDWRGFKEGFSGWDLISGSKMTNATLAQVVSQDKKSSGIIVKFGNETQQVIVSKETPITTFGVEKDYVLKVGQLVVIFADNQSGTLTGEFVGVRENGKLPPI